MTSNSQNHPPTTSSQDVRGSDGDEVVGSKRATSSPAWPHFKKFKLNGEVKAKCKHCSKVLGADSKNGTKHLLAHYKRCIHKPFTDIRQSILVQEKKKVDGTTMHVSDYTFNVDTSWKDLAEMIIVHEYPLSIVEHHGFRKFVGGLQLLFKGDIKSIYDYERDKTMSLLAKKKKAELQLLPICRHLIIKKGFMAITTHFVNQNWNLKSRIMRYIIII
uniref:BED-type domain-containing protein n=1 Tax=Lactuca sativa TaxID=4236 RepID=A0A9R1VXV8_LACSA|nr:hypothetical protein LSAT_V11C400206220 [Lactuca sativa]